MWCHLMAIKHTRRYTQTEIGQEHNLIVQQHVLNVIYFYGVLTPRHHKYMVSYKTHYG